MTQLEQDLLKTVRDMKAESLAHARNRLQNNEGWSDDDAETALRHARECELVELTIVRLNDEIPVDEIINEMGLV